MTNRFETKLATSDRHSYRELFKRSSKNPILSSKDWPYAANTVFNPAATVYNGKVLLLARVEDRRGFSHLTKAVSDDGISNWVIDEKPTLEPDRIIILRRNGVLKTQESHGLRNLGNMPLCTLPIQGRSIGFHGTDKRL